MKAWYTCMLYGYIQVQLEYYAELAHRTLHTLGMRCGMPDGPIMTDTIVTVMTTIKTITMNTSTALTTSTRDSMIIAVIMTSLTVISKRLMTAITIKR